MNCALTDPVLVCIVKEMASLHVKECGFIRYHPTLDLFLVQAAILVQVKVVVKVGLLVFGPLRKVILREVIRVERFWEGGREGGRDKKHNVVNMMQCNSYRWKDLLYIQL